MTQRVVRIVWRSLGVLLLLGALLWVRNFLQPSGYQLVAEFDDVGDLVSRHSVQIADVRVGEVGAIELTDDYRARVTLRIDHDVQVAEGSRAILRTSSLLGEKLIELRPPSEEAAREGPFLEPGSVIEQSEEAAELEFVADTLIELLGAVEATDVATLVETGAVGFGGQREQLAGLVTNLNMISGTLAERSDQLVRIIDHLDVATGDLGAGSGDLREALANLAETTQILASNRDRAVEALDQLSRLARSQNAVLGKHFDAVQTQVRQIDDIVAQLADSHDDIDSLITWLDRFVVGLPDVIPNDFTIIFQNSQLRGSEGD